jgi:ethanolamine utilization protein EutQ (cupin superfamily)
MVPAQMRTALYRALLLDADTALEETAENADGRAGIALVAEDSIRSELLIDPATGQCIGERDLLTRADAELGLPAGTVMTTTALSTAVVDTIGALPR